MIDDDIKRFHNHPAFTVNKEPLNLIPYEVCLGMEMVFEAFHLGIPFLDAGIMNGIV